MEIRSSAEDYLETILLLARKTGLVRSIDIVDEMGFSKPSVSVAMKKLRESGHVLTDDDGFITLTESGRAIAEAMYERHTLLTDFFVALGVDAEIARQDACRIEHIISQETFEKIRAYGKRVGIE